MSVYSEAVDLARRQIADVERYIVETFLDPTLRQLLESLGDTESKSQIATERLAELRRLGIDRPSDYELFNATRTETYKAQLSVWGVVATLVGQRDPSLVSRLTAPVAPPFVYFDAEQSARARAGQRRTDVALAGLSGGLGVAPGLVIAAILIAMLVELGLAYLLATTVQNVAREVSAVWIARARVEQFRDLCDARLEAYRACLARENADPVACSTAAAGAVPTPLESGTETPMPGSGADTWWLPALAGVGVTVGVFAGGYYLWSRYKAGQRLLGAGVRGVDGGRVPVRQVAALPSRAPDLDGNKSTYNLEIQGLGRAGKRRHRKRSRR